MTVLSGGTDGEDGPTDAAGAVADATTLAELAKRQLDAEDFLQRHDAYTLFDRVGGLIRSGLTGTNVMDVRVVLDRCKVVRRSAAIFLSLCLKEEPPRERL